MRKGIAALLRDYYRLKERTRFQGDFDTAVILADLMDSINGEVLTPRQRQFIALYYFVGLTFEEVATISKTPINNVQDRVYEGLERLEKTRLSDVQYKTRTPESFSHLEGSVYRWLDDIAEGAPISEPPDDVLLSIAEILKYSDDKSAELLRQNAVGFEYVQEYDDTEEYPYYSKEQMRWSNRRISLVEEVFPEGDVVGTQKFTPAPDYDGDRDNSDDYSEYVSRSVRQTGRRKIFKLRGN